MTLRVHGVTSGHLAVGLWTGTGGWLTVRSTTAATGDPPAIGELR